MTIAFVNAGAPQQNNSTPLSPALPTGHAVGDLMLLICEQTSAAGITFTPPAGVGWVSIARNSNTTRAMTLEVFAKTEGAGESAPSVACSAAAGGWQVCLVNYRGVNNSIIEDAADVPSDSAAAATWQPTGISLSTANDMVLSVVASKDDNALALVVGSENGYTVRVSGATYDGTTGNGSDYSLGLAEQLFGTSGAKTCPTWNQTANGNDAWVGLTIALLARVNTSVLPGSASLTWTGATPTVAVTNNKLVTPGAAALSLSGATPVVFASDNKTVLPGAASLTLTGIAPTVFASDNKSALPGQASLTLNMSTPSVIVSTSTNQTVSPGAASLTLSPATPAVNTTDNKTALPGAASLITSPSTPNVLTTDNQSVSPGSLALAFSLSTPNLSIGGPQTCLPGPSSVTLNLSQPVVSISSVVPPAPATVTGTGGKAWGTSGGTYKPPRRVEAEKEYKAILKRRLAEVAVAILMMD